METTLNSQQQCLFFLHTTCQFEKYAAQKHDVFLSLSTSVDENYYFKPRCKPKWSAAM